MLKLGGITRPVRVTGGSFLNKINESGHPWQRKELLRLRKRKERVGGRHFVNDFNAAAYYPAPGVAENIMPYTGDAIRLDRRETGGGETAC